MAQPRWRNVGEYHDLLKKVADLTGEAAFIMSKWSIEAEKRLEGMRVHPEKDPVGIITLQEQIKRALALAAELDRIYHSTKPKV